MIPGGGGTAAPPAAEPQAAPTGAVPAVKKWAEDVGMDPSQRATRLPPATRPGALEHPFEVIDRAEYLEMVKPHGSIAKRTHQAPIALVNLSDLIGIQGSVNAERLEQHLENPKLVPPGKTEPGHGGLVDRPVVVRKGGRMFIHDGHHRLTAAQLRGQSTAKVRFIDLDAEAQAP